MDLESLKRHYCKSQVNGTISITTRIVLNDTLKFSLEEGAGEVGSFKNIKGFKFVYVGRMFIHFSSI